MVDRAREPLDPRRWAEVRQLFEHAAELEGEARRRYLDESCGRDEALREEVESLLAGDFTASPLDSPAAFVTSLIDSEREAVEPGPPGRIGAWEIQGVLGRGGMGTVYLGVRTDGAFRQEVAIKLLRPGLDAEDTRRRFAAERQILAELEHPWIARLFDGGTTADGRLYFVMEKVVGEPLDSYCESRRLPLHDRLELFLRVCAAVQHAHGRLVAHRDLKPSNIMVTADGSPKLLDFGLAKVFAPAATGEDARMTLTAMHQRAFTPEYASPEQVRGERATTASDVYSLGAVLYELLAGARPYDFPSRSPAEIERIVVTAVPRRPSERVTGAQRRALRGDLDNITLQALAKEPGRRYGSVAELAEDLRRFLAGLPVRARTDRLSYRLNKFLSRHPFESAAAVLLVLTLIGALVVTSRQARIARAERDRARIEAGKAREISAFLAALFQDADPGRTRGAKITAREMLERGAARIDQGLAEQPEVQASLLLVVGSVYRDLGLIEEARPPLERALALRERLLGPEHLATAEALNELGVLDRIVGRLEEALPRLERALAIRERDLGPDDPEVARSLSNLGVAWRVRGDRRRARALLERALAIAERRSPDSTETGKWLNNLGLVYQDVGELERAREAFTRSARVLEQTEGPQSPLPALPLDNLGNVLRSEQRFAEALPVLERARSLVERTWGKDHPQYGNALTSLADLLSDLGRDEEAIPVFREAGEVWSRSLGPQHTSVAWSLHNEAACLMDLGRPEAALPLYRQALEIRERAYGGVHPQIAQSLGDIGRAYAALGDLAAAEPYLRRGLDMSRRALEGTSPPLAEAMIDLADCLTRRDHRVEARALYEEALPIFRQAYPPGHSQIARTEDALRRLETAAAR